MESGHRTGCALLGLPEPPSYYSSQTNPLVEAATGAGGQRATQLSLAVLLGGFEEATGRDIWRRPTGANRAYFAALGEWGYTLSEVETFVLVDPDSTADTDTADLHPAAGADEVEQPETDTSAGCEQEGQTGG